MIHQFTGIVTQRGKQAIDVAAGPVVLSIQTPDANRFGQQGGAQPVFIYMHWNQETGPALYGFADVEEKTVFGLIISCSGIGPKIALAILADLGGAGFMQSVIAADQSALSKVSGIGAKKAEQIIFQLKDKIAKLLQSGMFEDMAPQAAHLNTVSQALESLNYSRTEINQVISHLRQDTAYPQSSFDQLMRKALSFLSQQR